MEVRIEIYHYDTADVASVVTSLVEVRIEIEVRYDAYTELLGSLPLWKCGLKYLSRLLDLLSIAVTSLVEVRIEIREILTKQNKASVTSLVEVRIEITLNSNALEISMSLPLWKCGLK